MRKRVNIDFLSEADLFVFYLSSPDSEVVSWEEFWEAWARPKETEKK